MTFVCDGCGRERQGQRVVFSTEATDERGVDVVVAKRWTTCRDCAEEVFAAIDEPSPFSDDDARTLVLPDVEMTGHQMGGYAEQLRA